MKNFLVFGFDRYYPGGGWEDFLETFDTFEESKTFVEEHRVKEKLFEDNDPFDFYQIVDLKNKSFTELGREEE